MTWYYKGKFDRRRLRREMKEVSVKRAEFSVLWHIICRKGDTKEQELARLAMADMMEEEGYHVMSCVLREHTYCRGEARKRRKRKKK